MNILVLPKVIQSNSTWALQDSSEHHLNSWNRIRENFSKVKSNIRWACNATVQATFNLTLNVLKFPYSHYNFFFNILRLSQLRRTNPKPTGFPAPRATTAQSPHQSYPSQIQTPTLPLQSLWHQVKRRTTMLSPRGHITIVLTDQINGTLYHKLQLWS